MISVEAKRLYDKKRYLARHQEMFKGKRCLSCDIFLDGPHGAYRTFKYCRGCVNNGNARRHQNKIAYMKRKPNFCEVCTSGKGTPNKSKGLRHLIAHE